MDSSPSPDAGRHLHTRPRSARLHALRSGAGHFVLDVESGSLRFMAPAQFGALDAALGLGDVGRVELMAQAFGLLSPVPPRNEAPASVPVRAISLAVAQKCNLACTYCYAQQGGFGKPARNMAPDVAHAAIERLIQSAAPGETRTLAFMGGEPLANRQLLHESTRYAARLAAARGVRLGFSMTTNGTLVTAQDADLFDEFAFSLTVSLDGMQAANDLLRPLRSGKGSFERVSRRVAALLARGGRNYRVAARVTVTPLNLDLVDTLTGLAAMGFDAVTFSPMLSAPSGRAEMLVDDFDRLLEQLTSCSDRFVASLNDGRMLPFTNAIKTLQRIHAREREHYPCGAGGGYMGVSADGGMFACHRFVDDEAGRLGDVATGVDTGRQASWLAGRHLQEQTPCTTCWARHLCSGGCHHESLKRGRPACDYIRGWLHHCLGLYADLSQAHPRGLQRILDCT